MSDSADVVIVGAGVQGASLAFHLAQRGVDVIVVEQASVAAGATGRSSGFVRMHYDLAAEAALAWASFPWFTEWPERVGAGDPGFVRTGFLQLVPPELADALRANVAMLQAIGIETGTVGPGDVAAMVDGIVTDDVLVAAYEPRSGYADPAGTAAGFMAGARARGARLYQECRAWSVALAGERVSGVDTDRGHVSAPVVVNAAGAWAAAFARTAGLDIPVQPWRHDTAFLGLPQDRAPDFPIVLDHARQVYFRPEGREQMLVGLETANELGGSPDRPFAPLGQDAASELIARLCERVPWMTDGTLRGAYGGQDGMTPDQRPILGPAGPDGFFLVCGFSGTGFKTAPAVGLGMAEMIGEGAASSVELSAFTLQRFLEGRHLVGEHPYGHLWQ